MFNAPAAMVLPQLWESPQLEECLNKKNTMQLAYLVSAVEVPQVLLIDIRWRNVSASSKPPLPGNAIPLLQG